MLAERLEARTKTLRPGEYVFPVGQSLRAGEIGEVVAAIADLEVDLSDFVPDDGGTIVERVAEQVYASFKARDTKTTVDAIYDGFLIALPGRCAPAVIEAVRRIIRDEAPPEYSRTFVPTAGDLAKLTRSIESEWRLSLTRLQRLLTIEEELPPEPVPELSEAERLALGDRVARLLRVSAASISAAPSRQPVDRSEIERNLTSGSRFVRYA